MTDDAIVAGRQPLTYATVDHVYNSLDPRRKGNEEKVVAACYGCNQTRSKLDVIVFTMSPAGTVGPYGGLVIKYTKPIAIRHMNRPGEKQTELVIPGRYAMPSAITGKALVVKNYVPRPASLRGPVIVYEPPRLSRWGLFVAKVRKMLKI